MRCCSLQDAPHVQVHTDEVEGAIQRSTERLQALMKQRYKAECDTVGAVAQLVKDAVYNETQLPYDLRIQDNELVVDASSVWVLSPKEQRAIPVQEVRGSHTSYSAADRQNHRSTDFLGWCRNSGLLAPRSLPCSWAVGLPAGKPPAGGIHVYSAAWLACVVTYFIHHRGCRACSV